MEYLKFKSEEEFYTKTVKISDGFESEIYRYNHNNKELAIKKYYDAFDFDKNKIEIVKNVECFELIKPKYMIFIKNEIAPMFAMNLERGFYPINNFKNQLDQSEKINLLIKLKEILEKLHYENIIYGDLNIYNVLTNGKDVKLCDSLNIQIDDYKINAFTPVMNNYVKSLETTEGLDEYMLNLMTIYLLNDINYNDILWKVEETLIAIFNKKEYKQITGLTDNLRCMEIGYNLINPNASNKELLIDNINVKIYKNKTV